MVLQPLAVKPHTASAIVAPLGAASVGNRLRTAHPRLPPRNTRAENDFVLAQAIVVHRCFYLQPIPKVKTRVTNCAPFHFHIHPFSTS